MEDSYFRLQSAHHCQGCLDALNVGQFVDIIQKANRLEYRLATRRVGRPRCRANPQGIGWRCKTGGGVVLVFPGTFPTRVRSLQRAKDESAILDYRRTDVESRLVAVGPRGSRRPLRFRDCSSR